MPDLAHDATAALPQRAFKDLLTDVCYFLLEHQYVKSPFSKSRAWQVVRGSGMGLVHSADMMDYICWQKAEKLLLPELHVYGVRGYWRYRDDILILGTWTSSRLVWQFVRRLQHLADYFAVKVETATWHPEEHSIDFLDMHTQPGFGCYKTVAKFKESSLARPLGEDSHHPPHVHLRWPQLMLKQAMKACTWEMDKLMVKQQVLDRFRSFHASEQLLLRLAGTPVGEAIVKKQVASDNVWWCVLPYHPCWYKQILSAVSGFNRCWAAKADFAIPHGKTAPIIRIAWKNGLTPLTICLVHTRRLEGDCGGEECVTQL